MSDPNPLFDQDERLRHRIEIQSRQIERVFSRYQLAAQVSGGRVRPRQTQFDLKTTLAAGWDRVRQLQEDLKLALRVDNLDMDVANGRVRIQVAQEEAAVRLLDVMGMLAEMPPMTAVLGLSESDQPVVLQFDSASAPHLLIAGEPGAGKTALMRTIAISLALNNRQSQFQLMVLDPETEASQRNYMALEPLVYLPHMLTAVSYRREEIVESLAFLAAEMHYRQEQQNPQPQILVLIDHAAEMLELGGEPVSVPLQQLLQRGPDVGIHLVLSTSRPQAASLDGLMKANCPMRIVGRLTDETASRAAAGMGGVRADYLLGEGDFVAVGQSRQTFFQAAFIGDFDQHHCLEMLHRQRGQVLVAQPAAAHGYGRAHVVPELDSQPFVLDEHVAALGQDVSQPLVLEGELP